MENLISIIIPTFNRAHFIGETLDSILHQTYYNWECIVVDDNSTDYTQELLELYVEKDNRIRYFNRPEDLIPGANSCRNYGFNLSKGDFINWFDSDDLMHPNKLEKQISVLNTTLKDMCVCQTMVFENEKNIGLRSQIINSGDPLNDFILNNIKWLTQAPIIRKDILLQTNHTFDPQLMQSQEWDYFVRLLSHKISYVGINEPLVFFRKHKDSISYGEFHIGKIYSFFKARLKVLQRLDSHLTVKSRNHLKNALIGAYTSSLHLREFEIANKMKSDIQKLKKDYNIIYRKLQLELAYYSIKLCRKGEFFLKMNR